MLERKYMKVQIQKIISNKFQPRQYFDEKSLNDLAESIKKEGLLQPILVRKIQGKYEIVAGERRYRACVKLGYKEIEANVIKATDEESFQHTLTENIQRDDLSDVELALSFKKFLDAGHTQTELADLIHKDQSYISHKLNILTLPDTIQKLVVSHDITEGHVRQLLRLKPFLQGKKIKRYQVVKSPKNPNLEIWLSEAFFEYGFETFGTEHRVDKNLYSVDKPIHQLADKSKVEQEIKLFLKELNLPTDWRKLPTIQLDLFDDTISKYANYYGIKFLKLSVESLNHDIDYFIYKFYMSSLFSVYDPLFGTFYQVPTNLYKADLSHVKGEHKQFQENAERFIANYEFTHPEEFIGHISNSNKTNKNQEASCGAHANSIDEISSKIENEDILNIDNGHSG